MERPTDVIHHRFPTRSKRPGTERAHIPTIRTPAERERLAALHTGPLRAADGGTARHGHSATGARGRPKACVRGGGTASPTTPPPRGGRDDTGPGHGHLPSDQPGPCTTAFPTPAATQPNRLGAESASQQRKHGASGTGADAEVTDTSDPQESEDPLPATTTCSMPQQREPSTGYVPGKHPGTTPGHPSPTSATVDRDQETMPPPPPRQPQRRSTGPFNHGELRAQWQPSGNSSGTSTRTGSSPWSPCRTPQEPKSLCGSSRRSSAPETDLGRPC